MTRLAITDKAHGQYAITGGVNLTTLSPIKIMQRVEAAIGWLQSQEKPHEVTLDDPSGLVPAMITAWILTCAYPCDIRFVSIDGKMKLHVGIDKEGHSYANIWE